MRQPWGETCQHGRNLNFHHYLRKLAALIRVSAMPLAVFYVFICVCVCWIWAHPFRGCCWVVMVVALCGCGWGEGLAVSVLMVAWWWHLSACFFRLGSRLTSCFLALFYGRLKVPHWKGQTLTTVCLTACNSSSEGGTTAQQNRPGHGIYS